MKKGSIKIGIWFLIFLLLVGPAMGQGGGLRDRADMSIRQTSFVLALGRQAVKTNKVYTGKLAKAHNHRAFAVQLFKHGDYVRAIHHSLRARLLAGEAILANQGTVQAEWMKAEDANLPGPKPSGQELEEELNQQFGNSVRSDEEACRIVDNASDY